MICARFCLFRRWSLCPSGSGHLVILKDGATALSVSKFALGVRISSAFLVVLSSHKFGKVSGVIVKGVKMNYLDILARLILLGGWVLIGFWIWSILHTPKTGRPIRTWRVRRQCPPRGNP